MTTLSRLWNPKVPTDFIKHKLNILINEIDEIDMLELKPISSISDEDVNTIGWKGNAHSFLKGANFTAFKDELRLLGYAIEWCDISVKKQIEYGWIKLKSK